MKIAFLVGTASNVGGTARVVSILTDALCQNKKFEIHVIAYVQDVSIGYNWNKDINFHYLFKERISMKKGLFKGTFRLRNILKNNKIHCLVSCGAILGPLGVLGSLLGRTKHIYWDHSNFFQNQNHLFEGQGRKITAKLSHRIVILTKEDEKNYFDIKRKSQLFQIYNPVDEALIVNDSSYNTRSKKIISVGRLEKAKNFHGLIKVAQLVLRSHTDWEWHIYGKGSLKESLTEHIKNNGLKDRLKLMGHSSNIYETYKDYAIMVMTSKYEGFPMTLIEGAGTGLPLVSYDIKTGPKEIIRENFNGHLIEFEDIEKMAKKIIQLIENDKLRKEFSINQKEVLSNFTLEEISRKWEELFSSLEKV